MNHILKRNINLGAIIIVIFLLPSCYAIRAYKFRKFELMDNQKLPSLPIAASSNPLLYIDEVNINYSHISSMLDSNLKNTKTAAFLVIKNDTVVYEKYFDNFTKQTLLPSFSVAKSFVSTLVGISLEEGKIKSTDEAITNYIPELLKKDKRFKNITIQNLLDMRSGIKWNEGDYGLKDDAIKMGFRPNMMRYVKKIKIESSAQQDDKYKSINTMLLGIIVSRATGIPLAKYLQEKIWQPLGMEYNATWNTDKKQLPITFGGLNATARDFAKLGTLFLKNGKRDGQKIISSEWINTSVSKDSMAAHKGYRNQWWGVQEYKYFKDSLEALNYNKELSSSNKIGSYFTKSGAKYFYIKTQSNRYYAEGILGQFVYINPDKNLIIVRLGQNWSHPKHYLQSFLEEVQNLY